MNILITGSTGFLGEATYRFLSHKHNVFPLSTRSTHNLNKLKDFVKNKVKPDILINFGWGGGSNSKDLNSIEQFDNIKTCIDLFNFAVECGVKRFIQISSSWKYSDVYGFNNYGYCKGKVDEILYRMGLNSHIKVIKVLPWWVYGPNDKENRFIPTIINKCLKNEKIELHPAQNFVDYIYVLDFVEGLNIILEKADYFGDFDYNICSGNGYKIKDLVEGIKSLTNSKSELNFNKLYPYNFNMEWIGCNKKIKELGWSHKVSIEEGLKKTIEFYEKRNN